MANIRIERASGWWELHHVICDDCGWRSRAIDSITEEKEWRLAKWHQCATRTDHIDYDDYEDWERCPDCGSEENPHICDPVALTAPEATR